MFKPNRLICLLDTTGTTLESAGQSLSKAESVIGRFGKRLEAGVDQAVLGTAEAMGRTGYEAIRKTTKLTRKVLENTLAPIMKLDGDEGFWKKTGKVLASVPVDMVWGNARDLTKGTLSLAGTTLGAKIEGSNLKIRKGIGAAGLIANMAGGTWKVGTSFTGKEVPDQEGVAKEHDEEMKATIAGSME